MLNSSFFHAILKIFVLFFFAGVQTQNLEHDSQSL
jgi:hypothetical protein